MADSEMYFWGKAVNTWMYIYSLLRFQGVNPTSLRDLLKWRPPETPQECFDLAFDLADARAAKYENPVPHWINDIVANKSVKSNE